MGTAYSTETAACGLRVGGVEVEYSCVWAVLRERGGGVEAAWGLCGVAWGRQAAYSGVGAASGRR